MAWQTHLKNRSFKASFDASTVPLQYAPVTIDTGNDLAVSLAGAGQGFGILQNHPKSGEAATVAIAGQSRAVAGASITRGDWLKATASGTVITVASGAAGGIVILGRALSSPASGSVFTMELDPFLFTNSGGAI